MKILKNILIVLLVLVVEFFIIIGLAAIGSGLDFGVIFADAANNPGHPIPILTLILPILGTILLGIIDIILVIVVIVKSVTKKKQN